MWVVFVNCHSFSSRKQEIGHNEVSLIDIWWPYTVSWLLNKYRTCGCGKWLASMAAMREAGVRISCDLFFYGNLLLSDLGFQLCSVVMCKMCNVILAYWYVHLRYGLWFRYGLLLLFELPHQGPPLLPPILATEGSSEAGSVRLPTRNKLTEDRTTRGPTCPQPTGASPAPSSIRPWSWKGSASQPLEKNNKLVKIN